MTKKKKKLSVENKEIQKKRNYKLMNRRNKDEQEFRKIMAGT